MRPTSIIVLLSSFHLYNDDDDDAEAGAEAGVTGDETGVADKVDREAETVVVTEGAVERGERGDGKQVMQYKNLS